MLEPISEHSERLEIQTRFEKVAEALVVKNGKTFDDYIERNPRLQKLISIGDDFVSTRRSTGYNLLANSLEMDILSQRDLMFYNVYTSDVSNLSQLLTDLVERKLVLESDVQLGFKASKVLFDEWPLSQNERVENLYPKQSKNPTNPEISKTLDIVATISLHKSDAARKIFNRIRDFTNWKYPDLRTTISLQANLPKKIFRPVQANVLVSDDGQIIVLKRETTFEKPWVSRVIMVNKELAGFITNDEVKP